MNPDADSPTGQAEQQYKVPGFVVVQFAKYNCRLCCGTGRYTVTRTVKTGKWQTETKTKTSLCRCAVKQFSKELKKNNKLLEEIKNVSR